MRDLSAIEARSLDIPLEAIKSVGEAAPGITEGLNRWLVGQRGEGQ